MPNVIPIKVAAEARDGKKEQPDCKQDWMRAQEFRAGPAPELTIIARLLAFLRQLGRAALAGQIELRRYRRAVPAPRVVILRHGSSSLARWRRARIRGAAHGKLALVNLPGPNAPVLITVLYL